jgi:succinoglycan biosynthesis protein ExoH
VGQRRSNHSNAAAPQAAASISARIEFLRLLLILGIVAIHIPFDASTSPYLADAGAFRWLHVFLRDAVFRAGVPCLSVISGYLLFRKSPRPDYTKLLRAKLQSVGIPFLIWNIGLFALVFVFELFGLSKGYFPPITDESPLAVINMIFAVTAAPINLPFYFLRDLMVCCALAPLIGFLMQRAALPVLAVLFVAAVLSLRTYIVLRPDILLSFSLGAALAIHKIDLECLDRYALPLLASFLLFCALLTIWLIDDPDHAGEWSSIAAKLLNCLGLLAFWTSSRRAITSRLGQQAAAWGHYSFWIFCSHYPLLLGLWVVWARLALPPASYPIFYVLALAVAPLISIGAYESIRIFAPGLLRTLIGNRPKREIAAGSFRWDIRNTA